MSRIKAWWTRHAASVEVVLFLMILTGMAILALMVLFLPLALPV